MTDSAISRAAQKVLAAFNDRFERCVSYEDDLVALCLAVAIRAAADVVVPEEPLQRGDQRWMFERDARQASRSKLLSIAAELEAQADG
jgi:hypothetical protein